MILIFLSLGDLDTVTTETQLCRQMGSKNTVAPITNVEAEIISLNGAAGKPAR